MKERKQTFSLGELPQIHLAKVLQPHSQNRFSGGLSGVIRVFLR